MVYWQTYEIAVGFDQGGATTNFEDYFHDTLRTERRVPLGSVTERASDGWEVTDGYRDVTLTQEVSRHSHLDDYVDAIHGGWDGAETVEVTLAYKKRDNTYANYNAYAYMPKEGEDYEHLTNGDVTGLRLRYLIIGDALDA